MANKEAVFSLRVDTGNSVQDVQSFDKAVNSLNKDLNAVDKTASSLDGIDDFTQRMNELSDRIEAGGLTMRDMTQIMKQYQTIAAQAGMESPVGQQALQAAAQLKDEIGDLKAATTALSSDFVALDTTLAGIETGAAVFEGFQSAMALTGVESEALIQTMVKLQATQGLVNAVNTIAKNLNSDAILGIQLGMQLRRSRLHSLLRTQ
jgi:prefoldin subunit 5